MFWIKRLGSIVAGVGLCFLIDAFAQHQNDYSQRLIVFAALYITLSVSLNLINGITGQFSIGHAAFYQIGAYAAGYTTVRFFSAAHLPPIAWLLLTMVVAAIAAGIAGIIVGMPSLRLRGDYLAIVTMGFGEIIRIEVQNTPALGGSYGLTITPEGMHSPLKIQPVWLIWLLAVVCIAVCRNLIKTAHGLPFLSVREDEVASSAMGVNVTRVKVTAFVIGSMFAGAAGALLAHYEGFITGNFFSMDISFIILTMVVLGGTGSITGSIVSAAFLFYLPEKLRDLKAPDGTTLSVTAASIAAALIAVVIAVAIIKKFLDNPGRFSSIETVFRYIGLVFLGFVLSALAWLIGMYTKSTSAQRWPNRVCTYIGIVVFAIVCKLAIGAGLAKIASLNNSRIEAGQLRMVIFAVTLIVLMLLRPEGIFGHNEFSWDWVKSLLGKKPVPTTEISG